MSLTTETLLEFARASMKAFGVGPDFDVQFDKELAKKDVSGDDRKSAKSAKKSAAKNG